MIEVNVSTKTEQLFEELFKQLKIRYDDAVKLRAKFAEDFPKIIEIK